MRRGVIVSLVPLLLTVVFGGASTSAEDVVVGRVPNVSARNLEGKKFDLKQTLESGPAVITFWTTWCKPCRKELPELQKLVEKYGEQGFQVIGMTIRCNTSSVPEVDTFWATIRATESSFSTSSRRVTLDSVTNQDVQSFPGIQQIHTGGENVRFRKCH